MPVLRMLIRILCFHVVQGVVIFRVLFQLVEFPSCVEIIWCAKSADTRLLCCDYEINPRLLIYIYVFDDPLVLLLLILILFSKIVNLWCC